MLRVCVFIFYLCARSLSVGLDSVKEKFWQKLGMQLEVDVDKQDEYTVIQFAAALAKNHASELLTLQQILPVSHFILTSRAPEATKSADDRSSPTVVSKREYVHDDLVRQAMRVSVAVPNRYSEHTSEEIMRQLTLHVDVKYKTLLEHRRQKLAEEIRLVDASYEEPKLMRGDSLLLEIDAMLADLVQRKYKSLIDKPQPMFQGLNTLAFLSLGACIPAMPAPTVAPTPTNCVVARNPVSVEHALTVVEEMSRLPRGILGRINIGALVIASLSDGCVQQLRFARSWAVYQGDTLVVDPSCALHDVDSLRRDIYYAFFFAFDSEPTLWRIAPYAKSLPDEIRSQLKKLPLGRSASYYESAIDTALVVENWSALQREVAEVLVRLLTSEASRTLELMDALRDEPRLHLILAVVGSMSYYDSVLSHKMLEPSEDIAPSCAEIVATYRGWLEDKELFFKNIPHAILPYNPVGVDTTINKFKVFRQSYDIFAALRPHPIPKLDVVTWEWKRAVIGGKITTPGWKRHIPLPAGAKIRIRTVGCEIACDVVLNATSTRQVVGAARENNIIDVYLPMGCGTFVCYRGSYVGVFPDCACMCRDGYSGPNCFIPPTTNCRCSGDLQRVQCFDHGGMRSDQPCVRAQICALTGTGAHCISNRGEADDEGWRVVFDNADCFVHEQWPLLLGRARALRVTHAGRVHSYGQFSFLLQKFQNEFGRHRFRFNPYSNKYCDKSHRTCFRKLRSCHRCSNLWESGQIVEQLEDGCTSPPGGVKIELLTDAPKGHDCRCANGGIICAGVVAQGQHKRTGGWSKISCGEKRECRARAPFPASSISTACALKREYEDMESSNMRWHTIYQCDARPDVIFTETEFVDSRWKTVLARSVKIRVAGEGIDVVGTIDKYYMFLDDIPSVISKLTLRTNVTFVVGKLSDMLFRCGWYTSPNRYMKLQVLRARNDTELDAHSNPRNRRLSETTLKQPSMVRLMTLLRDVLGGVLSREFSLRAPHDLDNAINFISTRYPEAAHIVSKLPDALPAYKKTWSLQAAQNVNHATGTTLQLVASLRRYCDNEKMMRAMVDTDASRIPAPCDRGFSNIPDLLASRPLPRQSVSTVVLLLQQSVARSETSAMLVCLAYPKHQLIGVVDASEFASARYDQACPQMEVKTVEEVVAMALAELRDTTALPTWVAPLVDHILPRSSNEALDPALRQQLAALLLQYARGAVVYAHFHHPSVIVPEDIRVKMDAMDITEAIYSEIVARHVRIEGLNEFDPLRQYVQHANLSQWFVDDTNSNQSFAFIPSCTHSSEPSVFSVPRSTMSARILETVAHSLTYPSAVSVLNDVSRAKLMLLLLQRQWVDPIGDDSAVEDFIIPDGSIALDQYCAGSSTTAVRWASAKTDLIDSRVHTVLTNAQLERLVAVSTELAHASEDTTRIMRRRLNANVMVSSHLPANMVSIRVTYHITRVVVGEILKGGYFPFVTVKLPPPAVKAIKRASIKRKVAHVRAKVMRQISGEKLIVSGRTSRVAKLKRFLLFTKKKVWGSKKKGGFLNRTPGKHLLWLWANHADIIWLIESWVAAARMWSSKTWSEKTAEEREAYVWKLTAAIRYLKPATSMVREALDWFDSEIFAKGSSKSMKWVHKKFQSFQTKFWLTKPIVGLYAGVGFVSGIVHTVIGYWGIRILVNDLRTVKTGIQRAASVTWLVTYAIGYTLSTVLYAAEFISIIVKVVKTFGLKFMVSAAATAFVSSFLNPILLVTYAVFVLVNAAVITTLYLPEGEANLRQWKLHMSTLETQINRFYCPGADSIPLSEFRLNTDGHEMRISALRVSELVFREDQYSASLERDYYRRLPASARNVFRFRTSTIRASATLVELPVSLYDSPGDTACEEISRTGVLWRKAAVEISKALCMWIILYELLTDKEVIGLDFQRGASCQTATAEHHIGTHMATHNVEQQCEQISLARRRTEQWMERKANNDRTGDRELLFHYTLPEMKDLGQQVVSVDVAKQNLTFLTPTHPMIPDEKAPWKPRGITLEVRFDMVFRNFGPEAVGVYSITAPRIHYGKTAHKVSKEKNNGRNAQSFEYVVKKADHSFSMVLTFQCEEVDDSLFDTAEGAIYKRFVKIAHDFDQLTASAPGHDIVLDWGIPRESELGECKGVRFPSHCRKYYLQSNTYRGMDSRKLRISLLEDDRRLKLILERGMSHIFVDYEKRTYGLVLLKLHSTEHVESLLEALALVKRYHDWELDVMKRRGFRRHTSPIQILISGNIFYANAVRDSAWTVFATRRKQFIPVNGRTLLAQNSFLPQWDTISPIAKFVSEDGLLVDYSLAAIELKEGENVATLNVTMDVTLRLTEVPRVEQFSCPAAYFDGEIPLCRFTLLDQVLREEYEKQDSTEASYREILIFSSHEQDGNGVPLRRKWYAPGLFSHGLDFMMLARDEMPLRYDSDGECFVYYKMSVEKMNITIETTLGLLEHDYRTKAYDDKRDVATSFTAPISESDPFVFAEASENEVFARTESGMLFTVTCNGVFVREAPTCTPDLLARLDFSATFLSCALHGKGQRAIQVAAGRYYPVASATVTHYVGWSEDLQRGLFVTTEKYVHAIRQYKKIDISDTDVEFSDEDWAEDLIYKEEPALGTFPLPRSKLVSGDNHHIIYSVDSDRNITIHNVEILEATSIFPSGAYVLQRRCINHECNLSVGDVPCNVPVNENTTLVLVSKKPSTIHATISVDGTLWYISSRALRVPSIRLGNTRAEEVRSMLRTDTVLFQLEDSATQLIIPPFIGGVSHVQILIDQSRTRADYVVDLLPLDTPGDVKSATVFVIRGELAYRGRRVNSLLCLGNITPTCDVEVRVHHISPDEFAYPLGSEQTPERASITETVHWTANAATSVPPCSPNVVTTSECGCGSKRCQALHICNSKRSTCEFVDMSALMYQLLQNRSFTPSTRSKLTKDNITVFVCFCAREHIHCREYLGECTFILREVSAELQYELSPDPSPNFSSRPTSSVTVLYPPRETSWCGALGVSEPLRAASHGSNWPTWLGVIRYFYSGWTFCFVVVETPLDERDFTYPDNTIANLLTNLKPHRLLDSTKHFASLDDFGLHWRHARLVQTTMRVSDVFRMAESLLFLLGKLGAAGVIHKVAAEHTFVRGMRQVEDVTYSATAERRVVSILEVNSFDLMIIPTHKTALANSSFLGATNGTVTMEVKNDVLLAWKLLRLLKPQHRTKMVKSVSNSFRELRYITQEMRDFSIEHARVLRALHRFKSRWPTTFHCETPLNPFATLKRWLAANLHPGWFVLDVVRDKLRTSSKLHMGYDQECALGDSCSADVHVDMGCTNVTVVVDVCTPRNDIQRLSYTFGTKRDATLVKNRTRSGRCSWQRADREGRLPLPASTHCPYTLRDVSQKATEFECMKHCRQRNHTHYAFAINHTSLQCNCYDNLALINVHPETCHEIRHKRKWCNSHWDCNDKSNWHTVECIQRRCYTIQYPTLFGWRNPCTYKYHDIDKCHLTYPVYDIQSFKWRSFVPIDVHNAKKEEACDSIEEIYKISMGTTIAEQYHIDRVVDCRNEMVRSGTECTILPQKGYVAGSVRCIHGDYEIVPAKRESQWTMQANCYSTRCPANTACMTVDGGRACRSEDAQCSCMQWECTTNSGNRCAFSTKERSGVQAYGCSMARGNALYCDVDLGWEYCEQKNCVLRTPCSGTLHLVDYLIAANIYAVDCSNALAHDVRCTVLEYAPGYAGGIVTCKDGEYVVTPAMRVRKYCSIDADCLPGTKCYVKVKHAYYDGGVTKCGDKKSPRDTCHCGSVLCPTVLGGFDNPCMPQTCPSGPDNRCTGAHKAYDHCSYKVGGSIHHEWCAVRETSRYTWDECIPGKCEVLWACDGRGPSKDVLLSKHIRSANCSLAPLHDDECNITHVELHSGGRVHCQFGEYVVESAVFQYNRSCRRDRDCPIGAFCLVNRTLSIIQRCEGEDGATQDNCHCATYECETQKGKSCLPTTCPDRKNDYSCPTGIYIPDTMHVGCSAYWKSTREQSGFWCAVNDKDMKWDYCKGDWVSTPRPCKQYPICSGKLHLTENEQATSGVLAADCTGARLHGSYCVVTSVVAQIVSGVVQCRDGVYFVSKGENFPRSGFCRFDLRSFNAVVETLDLSGANLPDRHCDEKCKVEKKCVNWVVDRASGPVCKLLRRYPHVLKDVDNVGSLEKCREACRDVSDCAAFAVFDENEVQKYANENSHYVRPVLCRLYTGKTSHGNSVLLSHTTTTFEDDMNVYRQTKCYPRDI